jgi:hypothetical protein
MTPPITINRNLELLVGRHVVAHLEAHEALSLAATLARSAFRRIAFEEGAAEVLANDDDPEEAA